MTDEEIIDFFKRASRIAKKAIIINDLHRHSLAVGSFALLAPILFRNRLISHDGVLSVQRSFVRDDWMNYLEKSGLLTSKWKISWKWAFRWILHITI